MTSSIYFVEARTPIRGTVVELLRQHQYQVLDGVGRKCIYITTHESILDVLSVVEQETGIEFINIEPATDYRVEAHQDMVELELV